MIGLFTPGPWFFTKTRNGLMHVGPSHNCTVAALLVAPSGELEANARLIAAAPELLAELENIANADPVNWDAEIRDQFREWAQSRARDAIAKALGEKPTAGGPKVVCCVCGKPCGAFSPVCGKCEEDIAVATDGQP